MHCSVQVTGSAAGDDGARRSGPAGCTSPGAIIALIGANRARSVTSAASR
eukprot:SAG22_NODE_17874_length_297_cov_0.782828_1_plen_49_part_10